MDEKAGHIQDKVYEPEMAANFFERLRGISGLVPNYRKIYEELNQVFMSFLDQNTNFVRVRFGGAWPKTDYLLKEHHASPYLRRITNDARVRFRERNERKDKELEEYYLYDFRALCEFISLVTSTPVPEAFKRLYPLEEKKSRQPALLKEYARMIVDSWDEAFIYGDIDGLEETKVFYAYDGMPNSLYSNLYYNYDWTYIKDTLHRGTQLNLIRPRKEGDTVLPELIILEPDFLVDISSIASCFENYSHSPYIYLLNKIKPYTHTEAILLGNFASQMLDSEIYLRPEEHSYREDAWRFFKDNAFSFLPVSIDQGFHDEAKSQMRNIHNAIHEDLPKRIKQFNKDKVILEPSFFSEMLGLQGRMDLLQLDYKLLIEQKSGKCGFPQNDPNTPVKKEQHYVQMLLYMLLIRYNFRKRYERNDRKLYEFLLYSKYKNSLLALDTAPELVYEAIKLRNGIVRQEYLYADGGARILGDITADGLNTKRAANRLWNDYQKPQIEELLSPIHNASALEQAYYYRFMTFLETEHLLAKIGNNTKENSGFASKWYNSLESKLQAGDIYDRLTLMSPSPRHQGWVEEVSLRFDERGSGENANFRIGDIVALYPYKDGEEPDLRRTMVLRCTIKDIKADEITLYLRSSQTGPHIFHYQENKNALWAIEHDFFESSFNSLYRGMYAFLSAPQERKDLLLSQREPEIDETLSLNGEYGSFNELALRVKQAKDFFLIIGPPGTGKTSFGLVNTLKEELSNPDSSILLLAYTNRAVDEICEKLVNLVKEDAMNGFIRIGSKFSCSDAYKPYLLSEKLQPGESLSRFKEAVLAERVFVGTTTAINSHIELLKLKCFNLVIIDEASQITEPQIMGLLSAEYEKGRSAISKFVLIGDHKQLPAVVQQSADESRVEEPLLKKILLTDCRFSLFERLLQKYKSDKRVVYRLTAQGRMHHDIALFSNVSFYHNTLTEAEERQWKKLDGKTRGENGIEDLLTTRRVAFIAVPSPENSVSDKVNLNEAKVIAATVVKIYELHRKGFDAKKTIGVIVPYRSQITAIRSAIGEYEIDVLRHVTIDTVERYQGSQREYIIYGFTIQKYYQLSFLTSLSFEEDGDIIDRKLNVALTRAREHLLLVGNPELLTNNFTFFKLMELIRGKHGYFAIDPSKYVTGEFGVPDLPDGDLNLSRATYTLGQKYNEAYRRLVQEPIVAESEGWPDLVLGRDMQTNLNAIGYGRINFSNQLSLFNDDVGVEFNPREQVLLYCYYIMRMHYCSGKALFSTYRKWMETYILAYGGRLQFIDIGCGPATSGIAFTEAFLTDAPNMLYTGIDISVEMKKMGSAFLQSTQGEKLRIRMIESFSELNKKYWDSCSELPTLIIFNFSYFFSNISARFAGELGQMIGETMHDYPLNKFLFIIQHSENDSKINSYKAFQSKIEPYVNRVKREKSTFNYFLNHQERTLPFCYEILESAR